MNSLPTTIPMELLEKYENIKSSFYTFYPHTGIWSDTITTIDYQEALEKLIQSRPNYTIMKKLCNIHLNIPITMFQATASSISSSNSSDSSIAPTKIFFMPGVPVPAGIRRPTATFSFNPCK